MSLVRQMTRVGLSGKNNEDKLPLGFFVWQGAETKHTSSEQQSLAGYNSLLQEEPVTEILPGRGLPMKGWLGGLFHQPRSPETDSTPNYWHEYLHNAVSFPTAC